MNRYTRTRRQTNLSRKTFKKKEVGEKPSPARTILIPHPTIHNCWVEKEVEL